MPHQSINIAALLLSISAASAAADNCEVPKDGYDLISTFPPEKLAAKEAQKSNPQFLGVMDYSLVVPGVLGSAQCWSQEGLISVIPGTTDAPCSQALDIYQHAVGLYARAFNKQLLFLVPKLAQHKCGKIGAK